MVFFFNLLIYIWSVLTRTTSYKSTYIDIDHMELYMCIHTKILMDLRASAVTGYWVSNGDVSPSAILRMNGSKSAWTARGTEVLYSDSSSESSVFWISASPSHFFKYSVPWFSSRIFRSVLVWAAPAFLVTSSNQPMMSSFWPLCWTKPFPLPLFILGQKRK